MFFGQLHGYVSSSLSGRVAPDRFLKHTKKKRKNKKQKSKKAKSKKLKN
jgi:hypothetical protein